jgi:hypothetical protein
MPIPHRSSGQTVLIIIIMVMVSIFRDLPLAPMHIKKYSSKKHTPAKQLDTVEITLLLSAERLVETLLRHRADLSSGGFLSTTCFVNLKLPRTLLHLMLSKHSITTHLGLQSVS